MKQTVVAAALLMSLGAPVMAATCTSNFPLGDPAATGTRSFGTTFGAASGYSDCYTFTLSTASLVSGTTLEINQLFDTLFVDVTLVSLFAGGITSGQTSGNALVSDNTPDVFDFGLRAIGSYTLTVDATVYSSLGTFTAPVSYSGKLTAQPGDVTPVPEPGALALALAAFLGVGAARRVSARPTPRG